MYTILSSMCSSLFITKKTRKNMGILGTLVGGAIQGIGNIFGNKSKKREAERAHRRQQELMDKQHQQGKEMYDYTQEGGKQMFNYTQARTNAKAQMTMMKQAGLNPALMYAQAGAGGQSVGKGDMGDGSSGSGGAPAAAKADVQSITTPMDMAQIALLKAQRENIEADTAKKEADTAKTAGVDTESAKEDVISKKFQNAINEAVGVATKANKEGAEAEIQQLIAERMNQEWETFKAVGFGKSSFDDPEALAGKAVKAGLVKAMEEIKQIQANTKSTNSQAMLNKTRNIVEQYKAKLAQEGINPDSPAILKLVKDMFDGIDKHVPENAKL